MKEYNEQNVSELLEHLGYDSIEELQESGDVDWFFELANMWKEHTAMKEELHRLKEGS